MSKYHYEGEAEEGAAQQDEWRELTLEDEEAYAEDGEYDYFQADDLALERLAAVEQERTGGVSAGESHVAAAGALLDTSRGEVGTNLGEGAMTLNSASGILSDATASAGGGDGGDGGALQQVRIHRHDMPTKIEQHSPVGTIIWALVILHLVGLAVALRAWYRQRRTKNPTMRAAIAPPQKQTCTYDMDKSFAIPKMELPLKALKFAKA